MIDFRNWFTLALAIGLDPDNNFQNSYLLIASQVMKQVFFKNNVLIHIGCGNVLTLPYYNSI